MPEEKKAIPHQLILQDRRSLHISGVSEVERFDDETVILRTSQGTLTVCGRQLQVQRLSVESGDLTVEGILDAFSYADTHIKRSKLGKMFR